MNAKKFLSLIIRDVIIRMLYCSIRFVWRLISANRYTSNIDAFGTKARLFWEYFWTRIDLESHATHESMSLFATKVYARSLFTS